MHILVTGGAEYIDSHIAKQLLETTDLSDVAAIEKIFLTSRFDALLHFAASILVPESVGNPLKTISDVDFIIQTSPRRAGDPAQLISDNTKIKKILDWKPKYDNLALICKTALDREKKL